MNESKQIIQSYVLNSFMVSTIYRRASTLQEIWFNECFVWEWDRETQKRGKIIEQHEHGTSVDSAIKGHFAVCQKLASNTAMPKGE